MKTKEEIEEQIKDLRKRAQRCYEQRASIGRGSRGLTDKLLEEGEQYEAQARVLEELLK